MWWGIYISPCYKFTTGVALVGTVPVGTMPVGTVPCTLPGVVFEHPPKFQGKIRHTKTDLLLVTKFLKVTTGYPRYTRVFGSYK